MVFNEKPIAIRIWKGLHRGPGYDLFPAAGGIVFDQAIKFQPGLTEETLEIYIFIW